MYKNIRMISVLGFDQNFIGMFASYCHLLKPRLKDHWVLNRVDIKSEVVIVSNDYEGYVSKKSRIKIIVSPVSELNHNVNSPKNVYQVNSPINSINILKVLNKISNLKEMKKKKLGKLQKVFRFKNVFSKFMDSRKLKKKSIGFNGNKSHKVSNKLLDLLNPDARKSLKIVFLGRPGSGKTTAISSVSVDRALTSDVSATDAVSLIKQKTTIGIDYGECYLKGGKKLRLYGTPGQCRYDYVQTQTVSSADIYVILVDLTSVAPFAEFLYYKDIIESAGDKNALRVVAFTHYDVREHNMSQLSKEIRRKFNGEVLTAKIDTRIGSEVRFMLKNAVRMMLSSMPSQNYYAENSLFLKNMM